VSVLRVYFDPSEIGPDGYPLVWHTKIKDAIREEAGFRCLRCRHPYEKGAGEWSPCDELCDHGGPTRTDEGSEIDYLGPDSDSVTGEKWGPAGVEAQWRILTVHHLNGVKHDCRWWNLVPLCQRCHLSVQRRVVMERVYPLEHSEWFKPYAAAWYAYSYLGLDLSREETLARLDELLNLERMDR